MNLNKITSFESFMKYRKTDLLLEELDDYASNKTNFSSSLLGRGVNTLFKFLNKGKNYAKLFYYDEKLNSELLMGILRTQKQVQKQKEGQESGQEQGQDQGQGQGQAQGQAQGQEDKEQTEKDKNKIYMKETKRLLNSVVQLGRVIEQNAVRFKEVQETPDQTYGKEVNHNTNFDA